MSSFNICTSDRQVPLDHVQVTIFEQAMEREDVSTFAQIVDSNKVAKLLRVTGRHTDAFTQAPNVAAKGALLLLRSIPVDEQPVARLVLPTFRKVSLQRPFDPVTYVDHPLLSLATLA